MFGGPIPYPKQPPRRSFPPPTPSINMPDCMNPGVYAKMARNPKTNYAERLIHFHQRDDELNNEEKNADVLNRDAKNLVDKIKTEETVNKKVYQNKIYTRYQDKLKAHEEDVERRRELLSKILEKEEKEYIKETIDFYQKMDLDKLDGLQRNSNMLREKKEAARKEFVEKKRIQQYAERSQDLTNLNFHKHVIENKYCQIQQMRENEARRESEREIDKMWCEISKKQEQAQLEREMQDAISKYERTKDNVHVLNMQIKAKKLLEQERKAVEKSDAEEMLRKAEEYRIAEEEDKKVSRELREKQAADALEQLKVKQQFDEMRRESEIALRNANAEVAAFELQREKGMFEDLTEQRRMEVEMYRQYLADTKKQREEEQKRCDALIEEYRKVDEEKYIEKQCKVQRAKMKLQEEVLAQRAKQLEDQRLQAERMKMFAKEEGESLRKACEINEKLDRVQTKESKLAAKQYAEDLRKQMEFNRNLKRLEMKKQEEAIQKCMEEENKYRNMLNVLNQSDYFNELQPIHPFRKVVNRYACECPENASRCTEHVKK